MIKITEFMLNLLKGSKRATGADFSHHKGEWEITEENLPLLKLIMDFVILRAGYGAADGRNYKDRRFDENYAKVIKWLSDKIRGVYWYFSSNVDWKSQFDAMMEYCKGKTFHFYALDFERIYNKKSKAFAEGAIYFLKELQTKFPDKKIFIYIGYYGYRDWMKPYTDEVDNFYIWYARYPWKNWVETFTQWFRTYWTRFIQGEVTTTLPKGMKVPEIRQIVGKSGIGHESGFDSDSLDFNIAEKELEDFHKFFLGDDYVPDPEPEPVSEVETHDKVLQELSIAKEKITIAENLLTGE
jgi:hypothetical protein